MMKALFFLTELLKKCKKGEAFLISTTNKIL